jgi:hypothetical protein
MRGILVVEAWWRTDVASVAVAHNRTESECRTHASVVPSTNPTLAALLHNIDSLYSSPMTGYWASSLACTPACVWIHTCNPLQHLHDTKHEQVCP